METVKLSCLTHQDTETARIFFKNNLLPLGKRELVAVFDKNLKQDCSISHTHEYLKKSGVHGLTLHYKYIGSRFLGGKIKRFQSQNVQTNIEN